MMKEIQISVAITLVSFSCSLKTDMDLSGYWDGIIRHNGQTITFGLNFEKTDSSGFTTSIIIPEYSWNLPGGTAMVKDDSIIFPSGTAFYMDKQNQTINGVVPSGLLPVYKVSFSLTKKSAIPDLQEQAGTIEEKAPDYVIQAEDQFWSPAISDGKLLYLGGISGKFYCYDPMKGQKLWEFSTGGEIRGAAYLNNDFLYFYSDDGFLYKIDKSGQLKWKFDTDSGAKPRLTENFDHFSSSPRIRDGSVFIGASDGRFFAVDNEFGTELWRFKSGGSVRSTPAFYDRFVYFGSFDGNLYALDRTSGQELWKSNLGGAVVSSPTVVNSQVIIGSRSYDLKSFDASTGEENWKFYYWFSWVESSAVPFKNSIYIGSSDSQKIYAIDHQSGKLVWETDVNGTAWLPPLVTDEMVFIGTIGTENYPIKHRGALSALNRSTGEILWQFSLESDPDNFYGFSSTAVVVENTLWAGATDGNIYGFALYNRLP